MKGLGNFIKCLKMHVCNIAVRYENFKDSLIVAVKPSTEFGRVLSFGGSGTCSAFFHSRWYCSPDRSLKYLLEATV